MKNPLTRIVSEDTAGMILASCEIVETAIVAVRSVVHAIYPSAGSNGEIESETEKEE